MIAQPIPSRVFVDTGAFYALADSGDMDHAAAHAIRTQLAASHTRLFTSNFIIDESYTLIRAHLGYRYAITFLNQLSQSPITMVRISTDDEWQAQGILRTYDDKKFSYTDATSFVVMDRHHIPHAFAFDRNFEQYGKVS
jgi:predicted nucleic acid-binding protein